MQLIVSKAGAVRTGMADQTTAYFSCAACGLQQDETDFSRDSISFLQLGPISSHMGPHMVPGRYHKENERTRDCHLAAL